MRRTKEQAEQTKRDVLAAALRIFSRDGFEAARLQDIAAEAGVTRGAIYHHFDSKAGLYEAHLAMAQAEIDAVMQAAVEEGGTVAEIARRIMRTSFEALAERPRYRAVMALTMFKVADNEELAHLADSRREEARSLVQAIASILARGIDSGVFRKGLDPNTAARAFIAYQQGVARLWLANPAAFAIEREAAGLTEVYMRGIEV